MPEKPHNFWQELKRRKVVRVVVMYAGAAYVIVELINNITGPLHLPEWIATLVILLLIVGFPLVAVLSWVFDITPHGIQKTEMLASEVETTERRKLRASDIIIAVLLIAVIVLVYPKIFKQNTLEKLRASGERISVAVMPFQNMTNDTTWNLWQDGIKDELINYLTNYEDLRVSQTESVNYLIQSNGIINYATITSSIANSISRKLDADVYINGSIKQAGDKLRVNAQIIDSKQKEPLKSFQIEGLSREANIFQIIDSLSGMIKDFLIISKLKKESVFSIRNLISTNNPDAYRYFMQGMETFYKSNFTTALKMFLKSRNIDSNFYLVNTFIPVTYEKLGLIDEAKRWCKDVYRKSDTLHLQLWQKYYSNWLYARLFRSPNEELVILKQLLDFDNQQPFIYYEIGNGYNDLYEYKKAVPEYEKALELYDKWDTKPSWSRYYTNLGKVYHELSQYRKEKKLYKKAEKDFPDDPELLYQQAVLALSEDKTKAANEYIEKLTSVCKERSASEAEITTDLGNIYLKAELFDEAEEYFREALELEPESPRRMNVLAFFLIDTERNITEGMELIEKALESSPDNYSYLHTKGWGLYKQGKYQDAYDILQKSWDLRMENAVYNHEAFLHLEAAKKAVADQKSEQ